MAADRLTGSDKKSLLLWIFLGIVGAVFAYHYFFRAFPEASIDFKVSRTEAEQRARQFAEQMGNNLAGYQSTIVFEVDENAKTYLERSLGLKEANQLMGGSLNVWYWDVRFFKPLQEEEYRVRVSPAGKVIAYEHTVEEARGAKSLDREEALQEARNYLSGKLGLDLNQWKFLPEESNSRTRPNRLDWSFSWERDGFKAKDAPYRLEVRLQGDRIGGSQEFLQVPQAWEHAYQRLRSTNIFYNQIALIPYGFLIGAALWLGISFAKTGQTNWAAAFLTGGFVALLFLLMQINEWGTHRASYDTHESYSEFILISVSLALGAACYTGLTVSVPMAGGEPLYRSAQPQQLRLLQAFTLRGIRSKEFFCASVVGISMAAAHIGFITAFYMVGSKLGVWAPQDLRYSEVVNTAVPWIAGVAIGIMAATSEEFLFRLFSIPFIQKLSGSRGLAIVLPAFAWGFLHSAYPQEPGYIRGLEVGLIGIVAGLVMLRWGIVATLIWHYTVDASLVGMPLIRSESMYFRTSGIVVGLAALAPLLISGVFYLTHGRFENVDDLLNGARDWAHVELPQQGAVQAEGVRKRRYEPLATGALTFLLVATLVGGLMAWRFHRAEIGDYLQFTTNSRTAAVRADAVMREHGLDPASFKKAVQTVDVTDPVTNEYLRRRMPTDAIDKVYATKVPGALWRVRYFKPEQTEEYAVTLKPDGSLHAFRHTPAEEAKGANLSKEDALGIATRYLQEQKHIDLNNWKLVDSTSDKRPNRTDHRLVWQENVLIDPVKPGETDATDHAYARMEMNVLGDEPANYRTYIKIPEGFERAQEERSLPRTALFIGSIALGLALLIGVLVMYFKGFRAQSQIEVPWRRIFVWGGFGLAAFLVSAVIGRGVSAYLVQYQTTWSLRMYWGVITGFILLFGVAILGLVTLIFGLAWYFAARAFGEERMPDWLGMPAAYYRDALFIAVGGSALLIGLHRLFDSIAVWWPTLHRTTPAAFGESFDAAFPALVVIGGGVLRALVITGVIALASGFLGAELRARWLRLLLFIAIAAGFVADWGSPADFARQFLSSAIFLAFVIFGIRNIARFNLLGIFLAYLCTSLLGGGLALLHQPDSFYRTNGIVVLASIAVLLAWPLIAWRNGAGPEEGAAA